MGQPLGRGAKYSTGTQWPVRPRQPESPVSPGAQTRAQTQAQAQAQAQAEALARARKLARARRRWRLLIVAGCTLMALSLVLLALARGWVGHGLVNVSAARSAGASVPAGAGSGAAGSGSANPSAAASDSAAPGSATPTPAVSVPQSGTGTFGYAAGPGAVLGTAGDVRHFRVAVENGIGQDPAAFASAADQILGDQRSWIGGGDVRFQRVAQSSAVEFTLYLASPATTDKLCAVGGVHTEQFASCRLPGQVIINLARWLTSVPGYGAPLNLYQQYALNHEVGRELGHGNEACPAPGVLAPVMQQQSQGLKGCVANAWPFINGKLYQGPALP
jgi:hypothetical protein